MRAEPYPKMRKLVRKPPIVRGLSSLRALERRKKRAVLTQQAGKLINAENGVISVPCVSTKACLKWTPVSCKAHWARTAGPLNVPCTSCACWMAGVVARHYNAVQSRFYGAIVSKIYTFTSSPLHVDVTVSRSERVIYSVLTEICSRCSFVFFVCFSVFFL